DGYITSQSFLVCDNGRKCNMAEVIATDWETVDEYVTNMYIYINSATPVHTRGWELEAQYQLGPAYARLSYTREKTSQPTSIASAWFGACDISELPSTYLAPVGAKRHKQELFGSAEPSEFDAVAVERQYADEYGAGKDVCGGAGVPVLI
ncbi:MAG: hypothetical protein RR860_00560, partial [Janthinobacterium sp.]